MYLAQLFMRNILILKVVVNHMFCQEGPMIGLAQCVVNIINPDMLSVVHSFSYIY